MTQSNFSLPVSDYEHRLAASGRALDDFDLSGIAGWDAAAVAALASGAFVHSGENLVFVGERHSGHRELARSIAASVARQGQTVRIMDGDDAVPGLAEEAHCRLLVINELPRRVGAGTIGYTRPQPGDSLAELIAQRVELGLSTMVVSSRKPVDWMRHESLGLGTHKIVTRLHMGIALDFRDPLHQPIMDRVLVPPADATNDAARALFSAFGIAPTAWSGDPTMLPEYFGVTLPARAWRWLNIVSPILN